MLNSFSVTPKVDARTTNHNNLTFNAVAGTLYKSHPESVFVRLKEDEYDGLLCGEPKYLFEPKEKIKSYWDDNDNHHFKRIRPEPEPAVVLQVMLMSEGVLCEIVRKSEYESKVLDD